MNARNKARLVVVCLMAGAILIATGDGFAQSYAGLYGWAIEHGLRGWKADSFPLMVDLFIGVGELGLFLLAIDGHKLRKSFLSWLDLITPAAVAASGWIASLVFNVGHVAHTFSVQATAAVPPLASMIGLLVLLRTLHRYVTGAHEVRETKAVPASGYTTAEVEYGVPETSEAVPEPGYAVPALSVAPEPHQVQAAEEFADEIGAGRVPSIRAIRSRMHVGQPKAVEVRDYLSRLAAGQ